MMKREKKQSEKDAETTKKKPQQSLHEKLPDDEASPSGNSSSPNKKLVGEGSDDDPNRIKSSTSPFKGQIDLNIQPEREDELSPGSDSGSTMKMIQDATERYLRQQRFLSSDGDNISAGKQTLESPSVVDRIDTINAHQDSDKDRPITLSTNVSPSSPAAG